MEAWNIGHQVVVHPQPAHRVVDRRIDHHRALVGILAGDLVIHLEKIPVAGADRVLAEALGRIAEIQVNAEAGRSHAAPFIADLLGGARRNVAWGEIAERRVFPLEEIIPLVLGDVAGIHLFLAQFLGGFRVRRRPDPAVVAERLGHQRELGLVVPADRDAGGVDLRVAGICKKRATPRGAPGTGDVAAHRIRGQEEHVSIAAGGEDDRIRSVGGNFPAVQIADDDALGVAVDQHQIEHFGARVHRDAAFVNFLFQGLVAADEQLLPRLAAGVKRAGNLRAAEGAVVQQAAVFSGKGHALRHALIDDGTRDLGEAIDVCLARAEVAALDRVIVEAADRVAVVLVIFRGVDAALGRDRVRTARAVLVAEAFHLIAHFRQRRGGGSTGKARADDDDGEFPLVRRIDELGVHLVLGPLLFERAGRDLAVEDD